ncbi:MAG TPA: recombinase family protein [Hyphomicrobiaceae bacterium]|nr:recombinase family protein [Hyphomicrobiaceae bacterium]
MSAKTKAIIYCRVSSKKQVADGHGLDSREVRCREYARDKGDEVSGGGDFMKRPGMVKLLQYLDEHSENERVVIFEDLKRYARDTVFHLKLRHEMALRNATREWLNFRFEDSPEGEFIETVIAAQSQLERQQNSR